MRNYLSSRTKFGSGSRAGVSLLLSVNGGRIGIFLWLHLCPLVKRSVSCGCVAIRCVVDGGNWSLCLVFDGSRHLWASSHGVSLTGSSGNNSLLFDSANHVSVGSTPYWHLYKMCHILFRLHVYDLSFILGGEGTGDGFNQLCCRVTDHHSRWCF